MAFFRFYSIYGSSKSSNFGRQSPFWSKEVKMCEMSEEYELSGLLLEIRPSVVELKTANQSE